MTRLTNMLHGYIECALWSSTDGGDRPLDADYDASDLAPETVETMIADCADFLESCSELLDQSDNSDGQAGHDFWLTRNDHGAGFWDGDWPETGDQLTERTKPYGSVDLYVGGDGLIYS